MPIDYLTKKKPFQALLIFALPMMIGNFFQQTYTMADSAIVGRYVGEQALAAVGASYSLTNIFICIAIGGGAGASVIVSRYFGAKEFNKMKLAVCTALITFLSISILLAGFGLLFSHQIMIWLNTPADVLDMATEYLSIYFMGLPFLFMYNILSSMFNALGKSRIPLCFLIFSSLLNIGLDILFVTQFHFGVAGVAWATLIAQGVSVLLSLAVFIRTLSGLNCGHTALFNGTELTSMAWIALPSILQQSIISIGMMLVQSVVNSFGSQALAGFSAAMRVESISIVPLLAIGNALSSYTAQNIGARKKERVTEGYHVANKMVFFFAVIICIVLELFHHPIAAFFLGSDGTETAFATTEGYLTFMGWFYGIIGCKLAVDGVLRGAGDMKMFTIANLTNLFIRVTVSMTLAPLLGISMIWISVPMGWFANWTISYIQYRRGKWKVLADKL